MHSTSQESNVFPIDGDVRATVETVNPEQKYFALGTERVVARSQGAVADFSDRWIGELLGEVPCVQDEFYVYA